MNQVLLFISRMVFIHYLSAAYLGVNGLFTDVLGILNLAELGVGTAMIYSLYEPAAKNDEHRLAQLMNLYRLLYRIVAVVVLLVGLALMPFLGFFIKDSSGIEHLRLIYLMYVANSVCSYLLSYKNSIYLAYQKAYVRNLWAQLCDAVKTLFQIVLIVLTGNFILYLAVQFVMQFIPNIIVSVKVDKEFPYLKECRELPEKEKFHGILRNVGAMSFHKLGTVIVRNTDSLLMSSFVGLLSVGIYSNYKLVLSGINNLMDKFSNAFTGSLGNLGAIEDETRVYSIYRELDLLFFVIYAYWTVGLFALFNAFITLCFGAEYCFSTATVAVLVTEFYVSGQRKVNLLFREAKGLFWYDRYKALAEAVLNLGISIVLVKNFGVWGVFAGTFCSTVLTSVWVEPYILYKYRFHRPVKEYFKTYAGYLLMMVAAWSLTEGSCQFIRGGILAQLFLRGLVCLGVPNLLLWLIFRRTEKWKRLSGLLKRIGKKVKKSLRR